MYIFFCFFFFYDTATPVIYTDGHTLSLHYALPICKTECFLVPMLDDLVRESAEQGPLTGVRALMLYPLNALIASQEKRLTAWTKPLRGDVRLDLYQGLMGKIGRASCRESVCKYV